MKTASYIGMLTGLLAMTVLIAWQGAMEIADILLASGWALLLVPIIWSPTVLLNARGWQLLFRREHAPSFWQVFYAQWMGRAVNTLLPVAEIGGEMVKARALILWGIDGRHASASVVVDKTVQVLTVMIWGVAGVSLLAWMAVDDRLAAFGAIGLALLGAGVAGFLVVQRAGIFSVMVNSAHKVTKADYFHGLKQNAGEVDAIIHDLYRDRRRLLAATLWRFSGLVLQTGEVWLAAWLLGHPIGILEALLLKSLSNTLSDAAFVVPNAYGVQEAAFIVLGGLVGLGPDVSLAISLAIRIREVLIDVPGLLFWQHTEGQALARKRRAAKATEYPGRSGGD